MRAEKYVVDKIKEKTDKPIIIVKDRGYDAYDLFKNTMDNQVSFVVRIDGDRNLLFKGKTRIVENVAKERKGKIHTKLIYYNLSRTKIEDTLHKSIF